MTRPPSRSSEALHDGSARGLIEFCDYAKKTGRLAEKTADAFKSACSLILSIDGQGWEDTDIRDLDIDQQMTRYVHLQGASAKPATLHTYRQRVGRAIELYLEFLSNPTGFRGTSARRPGSRHRRETEAVGSMESAVISEESPARAGASAAESITTMITYPYPLRPETTASLRLPRDLTRSEAKRLSAFLESLAVDPPDATPAGAE